MIDYMDGDEDDEEEEVEDHIQEQPEYEDPGQEVSTPVIIQVTDDTQE